MPEKIHTKQEKWLLCTESKDGLFNEVVVTCNTLDGVVNLFADKSLISRKQGKTYLKVIILDSSEDATDILLPDFPFEKNRIVTVSNDNLISEI